MSSHYFLLIHVATTLALVKKMKDGFQEDIFLKEEPTWESKKATCIPTYHMTFDIWVHALPSKYLDLLDAKHHILTLEYRHYCTPQSKNVQVLKILLNHSMPYIVRLFPIFEIIYNKKKYYVIINLSYFLFLCFIFNQHFI